MLVNGGSFVFCIIMNAIAPSLGDADLSKIDEQQDLTLRPAGFTFAIWGVIYSLLMVFAVYQSLPDAPDRNNDFIYNEVGWLWAINMICNGLWLPTF